MPRSKDYGIALGWPMGAGQYAASGGGVTPLSSNEFIVFGDSRTQVSTGDFPDTKTINAEGYPCWVLQFSGYKLKLARGGNFGVGGDSTTQMLARIAAVLAHPCPNVILLGGVNDSSLSESLTNYPLLIDQLIGGGKRVIMGNELPFTSGNSGQQDAQIGRRDWIEDPARLVSYPSLIVVDTFRPMWNSATYCDFKTGYAPDGLHPATLGNSVLGNTIATALAPYISSFTSYRNAPTVNTDNYDAATNPFGCLVAGYMMEGTGGRVDNVLNTGVATGWNVGTTNAGGATVTVSKGVDSDGFPTQIIEITGTATAGSRAVTLSALTNSAGDLLKLLPNDNIAASARVKVVRNVGLRGVGIGAQVNGTYGGSAANLTVYNFAGTTNGNRDTDLDLVCASQIAAVNAGWATGTSRIYGAIDNIAFSGGSGLDMRIEISRNGLRKVA